MMSKISIIMPVYNGSQFLEKSIESVSNQTLKDVELICVDDGSDDDSLDVLNKLSERFSFIKVFSQENQGSGKARNAGMKKACGEYIAFLDADDIFIDKESLEMMYETADKNDANIVSSNLQFVEKNYKLKENPHYRLGDYREFDDYGFVLPEDYGIPYAFYKSIFKREFLLRHEIEFPDLIRGQDPIFLAKVLANCGKVYTTPLNFYGYNYSIGGGVNVKINNYKKKLSYIQHFKDTCDVLSEGGLTETSEVYKTHFAKYLYWGDNSLDKELYMIYDKVVGKESDFFDKDNPFFQQFYVGSSAFFAFQQDSEEYFEKVRQNLLGMKVSDKFNSINLKRLEMFIHSDSLEEFKSKYHSEEIRILKEKHESLIDKREKLAQRYESLQQELIELEEFNKSLLNSSSWKLTKPLRAVMNIFR